jgi:hypothetical protein
MTTKIWKAFRNYEKEEKWLNEMSAKGLALTRRGWYRCSFEDCLPGEYIYRIEILKKRVKHHESVSYLRFMEENGVEYVDSIQNVVYFRKKAIDGPFVLYSDLDSKIMYEKRIGRMYPFWAVLSVLWLFQAIFRINSDLNWISTCEGRIFEWENNPPDLDESLIEEMIQLWKESMASAEDAVFFYTVFGIFITITIIIFFLQWYRHEKKIKHLKRERSIQE